ncbi:lectin like domain-containing protein [Gordonibacter sp. 28C]|uniref:lectin like domain-containing protein n=1 Tax=Gordonibacter sp. 28C TaxID=2078569 RepID=UPI0013148FF0|nr:lectin like domain-containing protein [Gordonibacter sp. 28C]
MRTARISQLRAAACVLTAFALFAVFPSAPAFAEPTAGLSSKTPLGEVVQNERGPVFSLYDTSLLNAGSGVSLYAALPEKFDPRDVGGASFATGVKNQSPYGDCWAFGALSSLESGLIVSGHAGDTDLSERHLVWYTYNGADDSEDASFWAGADTFVSDDPYNAGGGRWKSGPTLMRWYGTVDEASAPLSSEPGMGAPDLDLRTESFLHVQNVVYLPEPNEYVRKEDGTLDYRHDAAAVEAVKAFLMDNGALSVGYYADEAQANPLKGSSDYWNPDASAYCYTGRDEDAAVLANHEVSIVGWDDTFSKERFSTQPADDGAWIVKNSWGTGFGDEGYFYLSYYDTSFSQPTFYEAEDADYRGAETDHVYDGIYQYDGAGFGDAMYSSKTRMWFANVFAARDYETVRAVSAIVDAAGSQVDIAVYKNPSGASPTGELDPRSGEQVWSMSETLEYAGQLTFDLGEDAFEIAPGDTFSVVSTIRFPNGRFQVSAEIEDESIGGADLTCEPGQSLCADDETGGEDFWYDPASGAMNGEGLRMGNAVLKAYTTARSAPVDPAPVPDPVPDPAPIDPQPLPDADASQASAPQAKRVALAPTGDSAALPLAATGALAVVATAGLAVGTRRLRRSR